MTPPVLTPLALLTAPLRYLSRQVGAPVAWACVLWGVRHG